MRFRVCQIVAGVLNSLGPDAEISDDLYERMEEVMLERLRDKAPSVRAQAARALGVSRTVARAVISARTPSRPPSSSFSARRR